MNETVLSPEKGVTRQGGQVFRPAQPWSHAILQYLRHLQAAGLPVETMERVEAGREVYAFAQGEMVHPSPWSDEALHAIGQLLRRLHEAGAAFAPAPGLGCKPWYLREIGGLNKIWCHGDVAPWNMLTRGGMPFLLVDWEFAGPLDPFVELARACWLFVQLHDDDLQKAHGLPSPQRRARQVAILCDGYALEKEKRGRLVAQILEVIICETAHEAIDQQIGPSDSGPLWGMAWRARSLYWVWRHRALLEGAL